VSDTSEFTDDPAALLTVRLPRHEPAILRDS